jgi:DNA primase
MKFSADFFEHLRQRILVSDIVSSKVSLKKHGNEYTGLCPFHSEKSPSFSVNNHKRFYHCFGCGAHGDVIRFVSETEGVSYADSAVRIANQFGIAVPKLSKAEEDIYAETQKLEDILELALGFYKKSLNKESIDYLTKRGLTAETIKNFDIGYAPDRGSLQKFLESKKIPLILMQKAGLVSKNSEGFKSEIFRDRIIFPIRNIYKKVIAFGGRAHGDTKPKYINSPETILFNKSETLYAEEKATATAYKKNQMILVEGYMDVIAMHQAGFPETVAALGTAVTDKHISKIWKICDEVIFLMDGDQAGMKAAAKASGLILPLLNNEKKASFILLPDGNDPDDYIKNVGKDSLSKLIENRHSLSEFLWKTELAKKTIKKAEDFADLEFRLTSYVKNITNNLIAKNYQTFFKDQLWNLRISQKNVNKLKKDNSTLSASIKINYNYSEIEHIEYGIISLILQNPAILDDDNIIDEFDHLLMSTEELVNVKTLIFENLDLLKSVGDESVLSDKVKKLMENSGFSRLYSLLSCGNQIFVNLNISHNLSYGDLWNLLLKKHHIICLRKEYDQALSVVEQESFVRAMEYRKQIIQLEEEIKNFLDI